MGALEEAMDAQSPLAALTKVNEGAPDGKRLKENESALFPKCAVSATDPILLRLELDT
jgi:hypothetical protein